MQNQGGKGFVDGRIAVSDCLSACIEMPSVFIFSFSLRTSMGDVMC